MAKKKKTVKSELTPSQQAVVNAGLPAPLPVEKQQVEETIVGTPRGLPRGIAGTEVITDETGKETLVYRTKEGQAKVPVVPGTPAPIGGQGSGGETTYTASDGTKFTDRDTYLEYEASLRGQREGRKSAWDLLYQQFASYGLGSLVQDIKGLIEDPTVPASEFTIRLRGTDAYKKRFSANQGRIDKGLRALSEAEYMDLEDSYQDIMRRYGLPETYYTKGELGKQAGFEQLIGFDVSPRELEERISIAQERVKNAPPEVLTALKDFYGDTIKDGDILAYVLDPKNASDLIKRKVTAAEIGAGARQAGLGTSVSRAEELARYGVTGEQAREGFQTIAGELPRGEQLAQIYGQEPYTQAVAEAAQFGTAGAVEARRKRQKLGELERASFSGQTGIAQGALARERAGQF